MSYYQHYPVLKDECLTFLTEEAKKGSYFADLTFGGGGHSLALIDKDISYTLFGVDQDPDALQNARDFIEQKGLNERIILIDDNFVNFPARIIEYLKDDSENFEGFQEFCWT